MLTSAKHPKPFILINASHYVHKTKVNRRNERALSRYYVLADPRQTWERFSPFSTLINDDPRLSFSCHPRNGMIGLSVTLLRVRVRVRVVASCEAASDAGVLLREISRK